MRTLHCFETSVFGYPLTYSNIGRWKRLNWRQEKILRVPAVLASRQGKMNISCKDKGHTAINSVYYQWVRRGLSQFVEGTVTYWHLMRAEEGCSHCYHCKLAALWGRPDVMIGHLWTDCPFDEPGQFWFSDKRKWEWIINTMRTGSFKFFKRPLPGVLTILTL